VIEPKVSYEQTTRLVQELAAEQQAALTAYLAYKANPDQELSLEEKRLLIRHFDFILMERELTPDEWLELFNLSAIRSAVMHQDFPVRREELYDDDGR